MVQQYRLNIFYSIIMPFSLSKEKRHAKYILPRDLKVTGKKGRVCLTLLLLGKIIEKLHHFP